MPDGGGRGMGDPPGTKPTSSFAKGFRPNRTPSYFFAAPADQDDFGLRILDRLRPAQPVDPVQEVTQTRRIFFLSGSCGDVSIKFPQLPPERRASLCTELEFEWIGVGYHGEPVTP
jgi:hypothetical protein